MTTPIADFVNNYIKSNTSRLHMPGHKGVSFLGCERLDITEIKGADELYAPEGIILESEKNASRLFDTSKTVYSAGGSSQSINAMLYLALTRGKSKTVLAGRNAHKAFIYAAAKLSADVRWLYPKDLGKGICGCVITPEELRSELSKTDEKPSAVYITSPDYLGEISDIKGISAVCREYGVPLLVDNAHGAYTAFLETSRHPIHLGADLCCDSAHKTLPVLTGGGYLHIAKDDRYGFSEGAVRAMEIFGSTSPSYLILQSLDICNKYLSESFKSDLEGCIENVKRVKSAIKDAGFKDISDEPLKITIDLGRPCGEHFRQRGIECEYSDSDFVVFMFTPQNSKEDFEKIINAVRELKAVEKNNIKKLEFPKENRAITIREAVFSPCEETDINNARGKICGAPTVSCPPAVPIAVSGEIISKNHIALFKKYGIKKILTVK